MTDLSNILVSYIYCISEISKFAIIHTRLKEGIHEVFLKCLHIFSKYTQHVPKPSDFNTFLKGILYFNMNIAVFFTIFYNLLQWGGFTINWRALP